MPAVSPVKALVKIPILVPSVVLLSPIVGEVFVLQQTPREVTVAPPSLVIFPPLVAVVVVMEEITVVESVGIATEMAVVKLISVPYDVPTLFVAYART